MKKRRIQPRRTFIDLLMEGDLVDEFTFALASIASYHGFSVGIDYHAWRLARPAEFPVYCALHTANSPDLSLFMQSSFLLPEHIVKLLYTRELSLRELEAMVTEHLQAYDASIEEELEMRHSTILHQAKSRK